MAIKFFLSDDAALSSLSTDLCKVLSDVQGSAMVASDATATVAGPTSGVQLERSSSVVSWFSAPLVGMTISGTVTFNFWAKESNLAANCGLDISVDLVTGAGAFKSTIIRSAQGVELGTTIGAMNWTGTPTSTTVATGDRIRVRVYGNDVGTMATGQTFTVDYGAATTVDGDSYVQFTESLTVVKYPTPLQGGPQYLKFTKRAKNYDEITVKSAFEDGGVDTLEHASTAPQRYEFFYDGLDDTDAKILDDFWDTYRLSSTFALVEPRDNPWTHVEGEVITEVNFESYEADHEKVWSQSRKVVLVKYPA